MSLRSPQGTEVFVAAAPVAPIRLPIGRIGQSRDLWCWVACFRMVLNGTGLPQCAVAQRAFPDRQCCDDVDSCNEAIVPARIQGLWAEFGFPNVVARCGILTPAEIRAELGAGGPIEVWLGRIESCEAFTGDGHVVLIVGCEGATEADMILKVRDPSPQGNLTETSYQGLVSNVSHGPWVGTWTHIR